MRTGWVRIGGRIGELAERLGVGGRTVRRDVERLRQLGYDVGGRPGAGGGYGLHGGTPIPPLQLDQDEATAVAVVPGAELPPAGGEGRLDHLLPPALRAQLAALRASTVALVPPLERVPSEHLVQLALACDQNRRVRFDYRTRGGEAAERRVEPHHLVATDRRWYLIGFDLDRDDWRTFRVDRMSEVVLTGHGFARRPLSDPGRLVAEAITAAGYRYRAVVRVE